MWALGSWPSPSPSLYPWSPELNCAISQWRLIVFNYPSTEAEPSFTQSQHRTWLISFMSHLVYPAHVCSHLSWQWAIHQAGPLSWQGLDAQSWDGLWSVLVCWPPLYWEAGDWAGDSNFISIDSCMICEFELWNVLFPPPMVIRFDKL